MNIVPRFAVAVSMVGAAVAMLSAPAQGFAQQGVPAADAEAFIGEWDLPLATDMGPVEVTIQVADADGLVTANVGSPQGSAAVEDISKVGDDLVFSFTMDAQGQMMPILMTLTPSGEDLSVSVDVAQGMLVASGTATRAEG